MPNWCSNTLTLRHQDPAMIIRAQKAFEESRLLDEFIPVPADLTDTVSGSLGDAEAQQALEERQARNKAQYGYTTWYDFCRSEWGTKWDVGGGDISDQGPNHITVYFDSAWAPPVEAYNKLVGALDFEVEAMYYESGMNFCGIYLNGDDDYFELDSMSAEEVRSYIPEELDHEFGISDTIAEYEAEEEQDEAS